MAFSSLLAADSGTSGFRLLHRWRHPRDVDDGIVGPVRTVIERELAVRRGKPVACLVRSRRFRASIERQRTIAVVLERLVLGAQRIAVERVRMEEVVLIV